VVVKPMVKDRRTDLLQCVRLFDGNTKEGRLPWCHADSRRDRRPSQFCGYLPLGGTDSFEP